MHSHRTAAIILANGYCVDTVELNSEMIQKYVRFLEKEEQDQQQRNWSHDQAEFLRRGASCAPLWGHQAKPRSTNAVVTRRTKSHLLNTHASQAVPLSRSVSNRASRC